MAKVYRLHRKKLNNSKISELLRYLLVLQKSVPVIENLVKNSESINGFYMAINLIKNANELVEFKLQGIKLTLKYKTELASLKSSCIKNLEDKTI
jgi:hypothetical protein|tara:strand:- start:175 stop:459 length:285 start_codon:yes stop_codon:yes gene_type:complete